MSDFLEQLKERRSIRAFQEKMVPKEDIEKVIEAGLYAASGKNRQDSIIVAVTDRECRDWFSRINAEIMGVSTAPRTPAMEVTPMDRVTTSGFSST